MEVKAITTAWLKSLCNFGACWHLFFDIEVGANQGKTRGTAEERVSARERSFGERRDCVETLELRWVPILASLEKACWDICKEFKIWAAMCQKIWDGRDIARKYRERMRMYCEGHTDYNCHKFEFRGVDTYCWKLKYGWIKSRRVVKGRLQWMNATWSLSKPEGFGEP